MKHKYDCCLCGQDPGTTFMVNDELWKQVAKEHTKEIICWDCFERLLGRHIKSDDLKEGVPCNKILIRLLYKLELCDFVMGWEGLYA